MSLHRGDNRMTLTSDVAKASGDDPTSDDLCTCGYATYSDKTQQVFNSLEPLCTIRVAARDGVNTKKAKSSKVGMIELKNK